VFFLTIGKGFGGVSEELALFFAVQMVAEPQAFFEIPNGVDDRVGWTDKFVARGGDSQREIADACEFSQECFRIELAGVWHLFGGESGPVPSVEIVGRLARAWELLKIYPI
jgi:hypothetical protein